MKINDSKIILIFLGIAIFFSLSWHINKSNKINHTALFELKSECMNKAEKFAENRSKSEISFTSQWVVLRSNYNQKKKSCFGEFMELVSRSDNSSFGEYWIFNLLSGERVDGYTFEERDSSGRINLDERNLQYLKGAKARYENTSKEIFLN